ncbi:MAG: hypothetical protein KGL63_01735 [Betaproteobacteria bacterium]|nr:hypothetical protein [Betaproteobacteria bacterium]
MSDEVTMQIRLQDIRKIRDALRECGQDLIAEVDGNYSEAERARPTLNKRWMRDRQPGIDAVKLADFLDGFMGVYA